MHRILMTMLFLAAWPIGFAAAQQPPLRPGDPARPAATVPGDEIKLDESGVLKASAIQSKMSAILANFALLQRQAQDLQNEMTRALDERKKLLEDAARRTRVDVREPNEWVFDEPGQRYVRTRK